MTDGAERTSRRSLPQLVSELPQLFIALVRAELDQLKKELIGKAKNAGIGIGLFVGALLLLPLLVPVLIAAAILAFCLILPPWASALIVAGIMVVIMAALVFGGILFFKRMGSASPQDTIKSVKTDVDAVRGLGDYDK